MSKQCCLKVHIYVHLLLWPFRSSVGPFHPPVCRRDLSVRLTCAVSAAVSEHVQSDVAGAEHGRGAAVDAAGRAPAHRRRVPQLPGHGGPAGAAQGAARRHLPRRRGALAAVSRVTVTSRSSPPAQRLSLVEGPLLEAWCRGSIARDCGVMEYLDVMGGWLGWCVYWIVWMVERFWISSGYYFQTTVNLQYFWKNYFWAVSATWDWCVLIQTFCHKEICLFKGNFCCKCRMVLKVTIPP